MRERPILFQGAMVRALLAGTKTQTRRVMKYQPHDEASAAVEHFNQTVVDRHGDEQPGPEIFGAWWSDGECGAKCPYGAPGDRLWVREAWCLFPSDAPDGQGGGVYYRANQRDGDAEVDRILKSNGVHWKPSIHMPRALSRITLEITGVRVERLWEISDDDVRAEGCAGTKLSYAKLWEQINGAGSWDANPWVWVVEFRRLDHA